MQLNITGQHIENNQDLRHYLNPKFARRLQFYQRINLIHIVMKVKNMTHIAEAPFHLNRTEIHATSAAVDMYAASDELIDKLTRQLTRYKEKLKQH